MPDGVGYDSDFFLWTQDQAERLRAAASTRSNVDVDWENVAEELDSLGKRDRRELSSRLSRIYEHLLTLAFSSTTDPRDGWISTVIEQRGEVREILRDSPSLQSHIEVWIDQRAPQILANTVHALKRRREVNDAVILCLEDGDKLERRVLDDGFIPNPPDPPTSTSA